MTISISKTNTLAVVTVDHPPVNALNREVRQGLHDAALALDQDPAVRAIVLVCAGKTFIAGADIREFGKPPVAPHLPDLVQTIASTSKPWLAAIHGHALGGGLEVALACNFRIATPDAKLGFPEVAIGVVPGAGGTVMLPRVVSSLVALEMIASGKPLPAVKAQAVGLIDSIADGNLMAAALGFAGEIASKASPPSVFSRPVNTLEDVAAFDALAEHITKRAKAQKSPQEAVRLLHNALTATTEDALLAERTTFLRLRDDPQAHALRYIFFAERASGKLDHLALPRKLDSVGVIGGGTMGAGIAAACLLAGMTVVMVEQDTDAAAAGHNKVQNILDGSRKRGLLSHDKHTVLMAAFMVTTDYEDLASADLVIEAVFEDMEVKKEVFRKLEAVTGPNTILATNTSYLDVNEIAQSTANPARVIGLHFFSPAHIMKLLEIVVPDAVSGEVLATGVALAKKMGKTPVFAGVCDGFIANRIMSAYRMECEYMLEDGALPWQIDTAMTTYGLPMGIFQMQDLAGLDIAWAMRKRRAMTRAPDQRYVGIADRLCEMGHFGRKTGRGWYIYENGTSRPDPEVEKLIHSESHRKGIKRSVFTSEIIMHRILATMKSEGDEILAEGIAASAGDIDVVMVNAFGFPRWKGGPMFQADQG